MTFIGVIAAFTFVVAVMGNPKLRADPNTESEIGTNPTTAGEKSGHLNEAGIMSRDISDLKGPRRDLDTALALTPSRSYCSLRPCSMINPCLTLKGKTSCQQSRPK